MIIINKSGYKDAIVRELAKFATRGINTSELLVYIGRTGRCGTRGWAHWGEMSAAIWQDQNLGEVKAKYLIRCYVGPANVFPISTKRAMTRTKRVPVDVARNATDAGIQADGSFISYAFGNDQNGEFAQRIENFYSGYGGKRSPIYTIRNWKEGVIAIVAHESRHIYQLQRGKRASEVDCEKFAFAAIERYRQEGSRFEWT